MIKISVESTPQTEECNAATPSSKPIYGLNDKPAFVEAVLTAMQHVLAIFVGIITPLLVQRIKGVILRDAINSLIAALFNTFPNTTFSQNNGVIQIS